MKINFEHFQIQNWMLQTVKSKKNRSRKIGSFIQFPRSLPELWSLNCLKKYIFCNFVLTSAKNLSLSKQLTYIHFQKMVLFIVLQLDRFGDISVWSWRILLNFCWVSIFFDILITNISWTVAQAPINHSIFWKSVMTNFRCIYVHCFNRLRFLAEISTKLLKLHFLRQFTDHNSDSGRKHGN